VPPWWSIDKTYDDYHAWLRADGKRLCTSFYKKKRHGFKKRYFTRAEIWAQLWEYDWKHPMECPQPAVGQAWAFDDGEYMITIVYTYSNGVVSRAFAGNDEYVMGDNAEPGEKFWPPARGALVYSPGAPWAFTGKGRP